VKILVILGTRGLGDALEAFPAFELLRELWPKARLAAGCQSPAQERTVEMCPAGVARVRIRDGSVKSAARALRGFGQNVRAMRGFDVIVFLYKRRVAWPAALAARLTGARVFHKHGYRYRDRRRSVYSEFPARVFNQLIVAEFFGHVLSRLREPRVILAERHRRFADEFFAAHGLGRRPTVILNSMASPLIQGWGIERYGGVASALGERGVDVIFNAGTDRQVREFRSLAPAVREGARLLDTRDPAQQAAVIAKCALLIGEPTGQSWLATAVGTPVLALMGPGEQNYHGQGRSGPLWWPWGSACTLLSKLAWCQTTMGERCTCPW
jgi:ADP-heptose:LPS heptosyltransferase